MRRTRKLLLTAISVAVIVGLLLSVTAVLTTPAPVAQNATLLWEKTFCGNGDDRAFCITPAQEGFVVCGSSTSFQQGVTEAWVLRLDSAGNAVWNQTFLQAKGAEFRNVLRVDDGFLLVGNVFTASSGVSGLAVKLDSSGNVIWNVTLQADEGINKFFSACTCDNGFVLAGLTQKNGDQSDVWVVKLDALGSVVWNQRFGGSGNEVGRGVALMQDGCFAVAGYVDSDGAGNFDFLVLKLDSAGNVVWSKSFGGVQSDMAYAVASAVDGCLVVGDTHSSGAGDSDALVMKISSDGSLVWQKTFGGADFDAPTCVAVAQDGGFLVGGTTFSFGNGVRDFWLFKVGVEGEVLWSCTVGRGGYEEAYGVVDVGGGDVVLAGWTNSLGLGRYSFYVVKVAVDSR